MWQKQFNMSQIFCIGLLGFLCVLQSSSHATNELCAEDSSGDQSIIACSCLSENDTMIIQDLRISSSGDKSYRFPSNTTVLRVGQCQAVHLSGPTLTSLLKIHTLHFHDIDRLHVSYDFFLQYETQLQVLKLSSSGFAPLQDSLNIHAHQLKHILLDKIIWDGELNLLLQTNENERPDILAITNSRIKILGEINISSRYVKQLVFQNNTIDKVLTSALMQHSQETLIENNSIGNLSFLSLDFNTQRFTLRGNIIRSLALKSLAVNTTSEIAILNNTFFSIEQYALSWLRSSYNGGSLVFSGNHLYAHEKGSLTFYSTVINKNLEIENNTLHTETCDCGTLRLLDTMTSKNSLKHKRVVFELFKKSSFCSDKDSRTTKLVDICKKHSHQNHLNMGRASLIVVILVVSICGFTILILWLRKTEVPYKKLWMEDNDLR